MTLTCQNGWPVLQAGSSKLHTWGIPANNGALRLTYRNGSVGLVLSHCALRLSETVEDLTQLDSRHHLIVDDWGHAIRPVRGKTSGYSNHAGYAFDANATRHGLGRVNTFDAHDRHTIEHDLLPIYDGLVRWGGNYHGRKDEMHWEINEGVTMAEIEKLAKKLLETPRGKRLIKANPGQKAVILS